MALLIFDPGLLTTVQDAGRSGYERFGVPASGPMDGVALRVANQLVGNPPDAAALEFLAAAPPGLYIDEDTLLAAAGAGFSLAVDGVPLPLWMAFRVRAGQTLRMAPTGSGCWGILAAAGGVAVPAVLGSRSTYLRSALGGLEGRALCPGDRLPLGAPAPGWEQRAGRSLPAGLRPAYTRAATLRVVLGPQQAAFTPAAVETLLGATYTVSLASDRMGYRLEGPRLEHAGSADILSEGIAPGSIQVPGDGRPVLLLSDRQTTGGYPKIATVITADLPLAAQCPPGEGQVRFQAITVAEAQAGLRQQTTRLQAALQADEDAW